MRPTDHTGQRFGRLVALERVDKPNGLQWRWKWKCDCGNACFIYAYAVVSGHARSCGCLKREIASALITARSTTHGMSNTPTFKIWLGMIGRCTDPNHPSYPRYGGKGIIVCQRWLNSFAHFYDDMGKRPSPDHSIDRYPDARGNYGPGNCRWATDFEQAQNRLDAVWLIYEGQTLHVSDWAEITGLKNRTIRKRLTRGWSAEKALTTKINGRQGQRPAR